jgi:hypothetical protein
VYEKEDRTIMNAKFSTRCTALAAIVLVLSTGDAAFGDEMAAGVTVLRGTPPQAPQQQTPQTVQVTPSPLPSCPEGYAYSLLGGYCYRLKNPLGDDW